MPEDILAVQARYSAELKRTTGRGCSFAACGGGWYAMRVDGEDKALRQRWRRSSIERALVKLQARPDSKVSAQCVPYTDELASEPWTNAFGPWDILEVSTPAEPISTGVSTEAADHPAVPASGSGG